MPKNKNKTPNFISSVWNTRYEILEQLGSGYFGTVFKAKAKRNAQISGTVAVKLIYRVTRNKDSRDGRDIDTEVKALSRLRNFPHPHVVQLYTAEVENPPAEWLEKNHGSIYGDWRLKHLPEGQKLLSGYDSTTRSDEEEAFVVINLDAPPPPTCIYLVQAFCPGGTLRDWLRKTKEQRDPDLVLDFATQLADGLRSLHAKNLVHKDLKPENIFVVEGKFDARTEYQTQKRFTLKIGDFGVAFIHDEENAMVDPTRGGTLLYTSNTGKSPQANDVATLGKVILELVIPIPESWARAPPEVPTVERKDLFINPNLAKTLNSDKYQPHLTAVHPELSGLLVNATKGLMSASELHSYLLQMERERLLDGTPLILETGDEDFLMHVPLPQILVEREDLGRLLEVHDEGRMKLCIVEGGQGVGKTVLGRQFQQVLKERGEEFVIWLGNDEPFEIAQDLENVCNQLKLSIYTDLGFRNDVPEMIKKIRQGLKEKKLTIIVDNGPDSAELATVLIHAARAPLPGEDLGDAPFVLALCRTFRLPNYIARVTPNYVPETTLYKQLWDAVNAISNRENGTYKLPFQSFVLSNFTPTNGLQYMEKRLLGGGYCPTKCKELGILLNWNPLAK